MLAFSVDYFWFVRHFDAGCKLYYSLVEQFMNYPFLQNNILFVLIYERNRSFLRSFNVMKNSYYVTTTTHGMSNKP